MKFSNVLAYPKAPSTITLKAGIEGLLKRMIPEVKEVIAEAM